MNKFTTILAAGALSVVGTVASAATFDFATLAKTIGESTWKTSIFPDKKTNTYLLPVKVAVREKEQIKLSDVVSLSLEIVS